MAIMMVPMEPRQVEVLNSVQRDCCSRRHREVTQSAPGQDIGILLQLGCRWPEPKNGPGLVKLLAHLAGNLISPIQSEGWRRQGLTMERPRIRCRCAGDCKPRPASTCPQASRQDGALGLAKVEAEPWQGPEPQIRTTRLQSQPGLRTDPSVARAGCCHGHGLV